MIVCMRLEYRPSVQLFVSKAVVIMVRRIEMNSKRSDGYKAFTNMCN